jgi:transcriptional regulator with XRE-family HTH domain
VANLQAMTTQISNTSQKLRNIRKSKGWSLQDVERNSKGKWKAVVIGSYERSDRAISLKKAIELMNFYKVPMTALFDTEGEEMRCATDPKTLIFDQRKIGDSQEAAMTGVKRLTSFIANKRKDWNGEILSIRSSDLQFLAIILNMNPDAALDYLQANGYLLSK